MPKFTIEVSRHYVYQIEVEAADEMAAYQEARNWEIEDLEPYETKAWFETDVIGYAEAGESGTIVICSRCGKETLGGANNGTGLFECNPCYERGTEN